MVRLFWMSTKEYQTSCHFLAISLSNRLLARPYLKVSCTLFSECHLIKIKSIVDDISLGGFTYYENYNLLINKHWVLDDILLKIRLHCGCSTILCFHSAFWVKLTQVLSCFTHRWVTFSHTVEYTLLNIEGSIYSLFGVIVDATFYSIFWGSQLDFFLWCRLSICIWRSRKSWPAASYFSLSVI